MDSDKFLTREQVAAEYDLNSGCEISDCGCEASSMTNGIRVCERCRREFVSTRPWGAVYFNGRWHGVRGATYPIDTAAAFPGLPITNILRGSVTWSPTNSSLVIALVGARG